MSIFRSSVVIWYFSEVFITKSVFLVFFFRRRRDGRLLCDRCAFEERSSVRSGDKSWRDRVRIFRQLRWLLGKAGKCLIMNFTYEIVVFHIIYFNIYFVIKIFNQNSISKVKRNTYHYFTQWSFEILKKIGAVDKIRHRIMCYWIKIHIVILIQSRKHLGHWHCIHPLYMHNVQSEGC